MAEMSQPIEIEAIEAARAGIDPSVANTPMIELYVEDAPVPIFLKLENLGPIGSFKLRGAGNALAAAGAALDDGVYTASAGNMAQAVAWIARDRGVPCSVVVPDHAPAAKLEAISRLGASIVKVPFERWWQVIETHRYPGMEGLFVHPVCDRSVMAGNGTIGLEIVEQLPEVARVLVPYGGGGLSSGIASALRAKKPEVEVWAAEVSTAAALQAALAAGEPVDIDYQPSFVDGMGSGRVLDEMWPLVRQLLSGSIVVELAEVAAAVRLLATRANVVAEGAGAAPVAAALRSGPHQGPVVCVISGGNIDAHKLATILDGGMP